MVAAANRPLSLGIDFVPELLQVHQRPMWAPFARGESLILNCGRKFGKTAFNIIACATAAAALASRPEVNSILFASYSYLNLDDAFEALCNFFKISQLNHHPTQRPNMQIRVGNCKIVFGSMQKGDSRVSGTFRIIFFDEAALCKDVIAYRMLPTQFRRGAVPTQIILTSTPRGPNWFKTRWDLAKDARFKRTSYQCAENDIDAIRSIEAELPRRVAQSEIHAEFVAGMGNVFNVDEFEWWSGQLADLAEGEFVVIIGGDLASREDFTVLFPITNRCRFLQPVRIARRDWRAIVGKVVEFANRWPEATLVYDETGLGTVVGDYLRPHIPKLWGITFTHDTKIDMLNKLELAIDQHRVTFPEDPIVRREFAAYDYQKMPSGQYKYGAPDGEHDDTVSAALLAHYGLALGSFKLVPGLPRGN